jgi:S-formylglutathione hydrolase FrmB
MFSGDGPKALIAALAVISTLFVPVHALVQARVTKNDVVLPGANTTDPAAPFYVDIKGFNFGTQPPTRDPLNPKYPPATELPDGTLPPIERDGNFIIGPTHKPAVETLVDAAIPQGRVISFTMASTDSVIYHPSLVRDESVFNGAIRSASTVPGDPSNLIVTSSHPGTWTRTVWVYVPKQYTPGKRAPFMVMGDGGTYDTPLFAALDHLINQQRIPAMIAISIGNGGQDAQGSERGLEYDAVSGTYAEWVEKEVLPLVEAKAHVQLTTDPDGRASMGISSSGAAAFSMAWFHPEWYHRVVAYSPTMVNQQWPHNPALRGGAWEYHSAWAGASGSAPKLNVDGFNLPTPTTVDPGSPLIPNSAKKPIRFWFECGDRDLFYPIAAMTDGMHDWVLASEGMARVLASAGYQYQFVFARNAAHVDRPTLSQTLPEALEWLWKGYRER